MNKKILSLIALSVLFMPVLAMAQIGGTPPSLNTDLTSMGNKIANATWIIFTVIATIMIVVAGILFLTAGGAPEKIATARNAFIWGVVGVVVGIVAYGIIRFATSIVQ